MEETITNLRTKQKDGGQTPSPSTIADSIYHVGLLRHIYVYSPHRGVLKLKLGLRAPPTANHQSSLLSNIPRTSNNSSSKMPIPNTHSGEKPAISSIEPNPATETSIPTSSSATHSQNSAIQKKTPAEEAADRLYEERIEDEYAKREGGA